MTVLAARSFPTPAGAPWPPAHQDGDPVAAFAVRAASPGDRSGLLAMHERCSLETRIARWHAPIRAIPANYLAEVTARAGSHAAFVAARSADPTELIGLASACLVAPDVWELGMLVEDACQRQGVGRAMLRALVDEVIRRGGRELLAVSLNERRSVLHNLHELGPVAYSAEATTVTAQVLLHADVVSARQRREPVAPR